jgi:hypothetical protein
MRKRASESFSFIEEFFPSLPMDLINYSANDFVLNAHPDKIALITEAKSAIQSIIEGANEKKPDTRA